MTRTENRSSLGRNAIANVAGRGASALLWVAITPFALSRLGSERFAVWSLFFALGGYVATLDLGMTNGTARFVALAAARGDGAGVRAVLRRSLALGGAVGLVWCIACIALRGAFVAAFHVPVELASEVARSLGIFAISMFVYSVTQVLYGALQGFQRFDFSNTAMMAGLTVHAIALLAGLWLGMGLIAAAGAAVLGQGLSAVLAGLWVRRSVHGLADAPERAATFSWRELMSFGGKLQATSIFAVGLQQAGKVLLGVLGPLVWVTQFELGFRVANAIWSLPSLIQGAVIPAAAHASAAETHGDLRRVYEWACRWVFVLAGLTLAGLWLTAPALFTLWIGPGHEESVAVARTLALALAVATLSGPATAVARGGGWALLETMMVMGAFVINVLVCLWAEPRFGPQGAVLGLGVGYLVAGSWLLARFHRRIEVRTVPWLATMVAPRLLLPGAIALGLGLVTAGWGVSTRGAAILVLSVQGFAFLALSTLALWPTGDPALVVARARGWWRRVFEATPGRAA